MDAVETRPVGGGRLKILLTGSAGMLGSDLLRTLVDRGHEVRSPWRIDFDVTAPESIDRLRKGDFGRYDWIINCAAFTAVDQAESDRMAAMRVNAVAPGMLGVATQGCGARVLHLSTDFVFDGGATTPYREDSPTGPVNFYGQSKRMGEENLMKEAPDSVVVRTSWLFGPKGKSFPRTMIEAFRAGKELRVVADQRGRPTYTMDLAAVLADLVERGVAGGIYHAAGPDIVTWWDLAVLSIEADLARSGKEIAGVTGAIQPVTTAEYPTPAKRPAYSVLDTTKLEAAGFGPMRPVREALTEFVERLASETEPTTLS